MKFKVCKKTKQGNRKLHAGTLAGPAILRDATRSLEQGLAVLEASWKDLQASDLSEYAIALTN